MPDEVTVNDVLKGMAPSPDGSPEPEEDVRSRTEEDVDSEQPEVSEVDRIKAEYEDRLKGMQSGFNKKIEELQQQLRQNDERAAQREQQRLEESWADRIRNARSDGERNKLEAQYERERRQQMERQFQQMLANQQMMENLKRAKGFIAETTGVDVSLLDDVNDPDEAWLKSVVKMREQYEEMSAELERMKHANVSVDTGKPAKRQPEDSKAEKALKAGDLTTYFREKLKESGVPDKQ